MDETQLAIEIITNCKENFINSVIEERKNERARHALSVIKVADLYAERTTHNFLGETYPSETASSFLRGVATMLPLLLMCNDGLCQANIEHEKAVTQLSKLMKTIDDISDLLFFERAAESSRYDLASCRVVSPTKIEIEGTAGDAEALERADRDELLEAERADRTEEWRCINEAETKWKQKSGWDLYYRGSPQCAHDRTIIIRMKVEEYERDYAEAGAFPDSSRIGPLTFRQWKDIANNLYILGEAKALAEEQRLQVWAQNNLPHFLAMPPTEITNAELKEAFTLPGGAIDEEMFKKILSCFILDEKNASADYDIDSVTPLLVGVGGRIFMTRFGRRWNRYAFLLQRLVLEYHSELGKPIREREMQFASDLANRLDPDRYLVGGQFDIYRPSGEVITDIDAVIYEKGTNCLYLIQLKWNAVTTGDLSAREKEYEKLEKAARWVRKVEDWLLSQPKSAVIREAGMTDVGIHEETMEVRLLVLNRWWASFSNKEAFYQGAVWLSWSRFCLLLRRADASVEPLNWAWHQAKQPSTTSRTVPAKELTRKFLDVELTYRR